MNLFKSLSFMLTFLFLFSFNTPCFSKTASLSKNLSIPNPSLQHLQELTDDTGIFEFAAYDIADKKHAYCTEDNARALVAALMFNKYEKELSSAVIPFLSSYLGGHADVRTDAATRGRILKNTDKTAIKLAKIYMSYLLYALDEKEGNFRHRLDFQRISHDWVTEDAYGRAIWGLGYAVAYPVNDNMGNLARKMFKKTFARSKNLIWPRAKTYTLMGLHYYIEANPSSENDFSGKPLLLKDVKKRLVFLADSLVSLYKKNSSPEWQWFEKTATYDNAKIPLALFLAYKHTENKEYLDVAKKTLDFLIKVNFPDGKMMRVIGNRGWYSKGKKPAIYDQQPIDAAAMVEACAEAYVITGMKKYKEKMILAFGWFLGNNIAGKPIYDFENGGSRDGIADFGINQNEGAESSIEVLISLLTLKETLKAQMPQK